MAQVDHAAEAEKLAAAADKSLEWANKQAQDEPAAQAGFAEAQVFATLCVSHRLAALTVALREGRGI
jgi:hypothetical protein